jgi:hypothetical protein
MGICDVARTLCPALNPSARHPGTPPSTPQLFAPFYLSLLALLFLTTCPSFPALPRRSLCLFLSARYDERARVLPEGDVEYVRVCCALPPRTWREISFSTSLLFDPANAKLSDLTLRKNCCNLSQSVATFVSFASTAACATYTAPSHASVRSTPRSLRSRTGDWPLRLTSPSLRRCASSQKRKKRVLGKTANRKKKLGLSVV